MSAYGTKLAEGFSNKVMERVYDMSLLDSIVNRNYEGEINGIGSKLNILDFSKLSEKTYVMFIDIINPERHPRTLAGVEGGWQLDHIKTVRECYECGLTPEEASSIENLRMLPWRDNLSRNKK